MVDQEKYFQALSAGKMDEVKALTQKALDAGDSPDKILKEGLIKAMDRIGMLFKNNEIYIPEVLIAARAMHAGLGVLKPILAKSNISAAAKIVIGVSGSNDICDCILLSSVAAAQAAHQLLFGSARPLTSSVPPMTCSAILILASMPARPSMTMRCACGEPAPCMDSTMLVTLVMFSI